MRASKSGKTLSFYNDGEYNVWKTATADSATWKIKYFKGLGTSKSEEFKEYFANKKIVDFVYENSDDVIDKVFNAVKIYLSDAESSPPCNLVPN